MVLATPWVISDLIPIGDAAIVEIGKHFFSDYLLPFELASVLLLMSMIGAIVLARRDFLPDELPGQRPQQPTVLTLPERPRELISGSKK